MATRHSKAQVQSMILCLRSRRVAAMLEIVSSDSECVPPAMLFLRMSPLFSGSPVFLVHQRLYAHPPQMIVDCAGQTAGYRQEAGSFSIPPGYRRVMRWRSSRKMKAIPTVPMRSDSAKNRGELHHHHRPSSAIIGHHRHYRRMRSGYHALAARHCLDASPCALTSTVYRGKTFLRK